MYILQHHIAVALKPLQKSSRAIFLCSFLILLSCFSTIPFFVSYSSITDYFSLYLLSENLAKLHFYLENITISCPIQFHCLFLLCLFLGAGSVRLVCRVRWLNFAVILARHFCALHFSHSYIITEKLFLLTFLSYSSAIQTVYFSFIFHLLLVCWSLQRKDM